MSKRTFEIHITHKSTVEMKLMIKFLLFCIISLNFDTYFLEFPRDIVYGVFSGNCLDL